MPDFLRQGPPLREQHRPADKAQLVVRVLLQQDEVLLQKQGIADMTKLTQADKQCCVKP